MNREETLALYEQGVEAWNKWANEMLEERKRLEEDGKWDAIEHSHRDLEPKNEKTKDWLDKAEANFSTPWHDHTFESKSNFAGFSFPSTVYFENALFKKEAAFENTIFFGEASFTNAIFNERTWFENATFNSTAVFNDCIFKGTIWFINTKFKSRALFYTSNFQKHSSFLDSEFNHIAIFSAIRSNSAFSLTRTNFKKYLPSFYQANFKEAPRLDNTKFGNTVSPGNFINSITTYIHSDIKASYQALKRLAIQGHDHKNEQRFWAGELRSDRSLRTEDEGWNLRPLASAFWWGNIAYGFFSNYGRSIVLPLANFLAFILMMAGIHIYAHNTLNKEPTPTSRTKTHIIQQSNLKDCDIRSSAFRVAAKNGAIGLLQNPAKRSTFVRDYTCLYGTYNDNVTPKIPNSIFWIELFHTLFSAILIFLTLLGIRNNFKLK